MFSLDRLELRRLLSVNRPEVSHVPGVCCCSGCSLPPDAGKWDFAAASLASGPEANVPLSEIPLLDSKPDAPVKLFLDFDGRTVNSWAGRNPGTQPAYTVDGDNTTYSPQELSNINEIWRRVSEKYSPFNVNVTTRDPGNIIARQSFVVMISGSGAWYGSAGGVAFVNGFQSGGLSGLGWVFPEQSPNNLQFIAEAAAHEAGHGFGLSHQSTYTANGTLNQEYNPGTSLRAPTMGNSYTTRRGLWWVGPSSGLGGGTQFDVDVLSRGENVFGYRADEAGGSIGSAALLPLDGFTVNTQGVLTTVADVDIYRFEAGSGLVSLTVSGPTAATGANIGMIDPSIAILDAFGNVLSSRVTVNANETLNYNVTSPGVLYVRISSHGDVGDIGSYTLAGSVPSANLPAAPSSVAVATGSDNGFSSVDGVTNDSTPTISGFAQAGATVRLYNGLTLLGTTVADQDSQWSITTSQLTDGQYSLTATAQDVRGTSPFSSPLSVKIDTVAPSLTFSFFDYESHQEVYYGFTENIASSLAPTSLSVIDLANGNSVAATFLVQEYGNTVVLSAEHTLPDGNLRAFFSPGAAADAAGNTVLGTTSVDFFVLAGDANRDRRVNLSDFTVLAANFSRTNRLFSQGDFDYDDRVDLNDFTVLAANFGVLLPLPTDLPRTEAKREAPTSPLFAATPIDGESQIELIEGDTASYLPLDQRDQLIRLSK